MSFAKKEILAAVGDPTHAPSLTTLQSILIPLLNIFCNAGQTLPLLSSMKFMMII